MGRVKFRCPKCGARRFQFTVRDEIKQTRHGAICCQCGCQVKASNLYQLHLSYQRRIK